MTKSGTGLVWGLWWVCVDRLIYVHDTILIYLEHMFLKKFDSEKDSTLTGKQTYIHKGLNTYTNSVSIMSELWNEHSSHFTYRFSGVYFVFNSGSPSSFRQDANVNLPAALIYLIFRLQTKHLQTILGIVVYGWYLMLNLGKHITPEVIWSIWSLFQRELLLQLLYHITIPMQLTALICFHRPIIHNLNLGAPCWRYWPHIVLWANYVSCLTPLVYYVSSIAEDLLSNGRKCCIKLSVTGECKPCVVVEQTTLICTKFDVWVGRKMCIYCIYNDWPHTIYSICWGAKYILHFLLS